MTRFLNISYLYHFGLWYLYHTDQQISILYYVIEMISILLAKQGFISPAIGAWSPFVLFFLFGALLLNSVKT